MSRCVYAAVFLLPHPFFECRYVFLAYTDLIADGSKPRHVFSDTPAECAGNCARITDVSWEATAGFLAGVWTFCAIAIHSLFELKSWRHIFINGGYSLVALTLMRAIIGLWR